MELAPLATMQAEPVRLVVWDLDETYWTGTLTEGGIQYNVVHQEIVQELARRGIVGSICSKNDEAEVFAILDQHGMRNHFVFPSINWESKGPRLAALIEASQLRPATILFIDDNPQNLAEAQYFVPGIQVADETIIATLLDDPLLRGKDDRGLTRLKQYRLLQTRQAEEKTFGADNTEFLRGSNLVVMIEHDVEKHIDRAIELINRTNQLNYTKFRLPENIDEAKAALRAMLSDYRTQAGLLHVRDRYGDYGFCGLYVLKTGPGWRRLLEFCFSCRILNMGVERWLYQRLGHPTIRIVGEVSTDLKNPAGPVDWITLEEFGEEPAFSETARREWYFYARGGCDLLAVSRYFSLVAEDVFGDFNSVRRGTDVRLDHSMFARWSLTGVDSDSRRALGLLGYHDDDFACALPTLPKTTPGVWLLSFWADSDHALYRHKKTGVAAPLSAGGHPTNIRNIFAPDGPKRGLAAEHLDRLEAEFDYTGSISNADLETNIRLILESAPRGTRIFILLSNEYTFRESGQINVWAKKVHYNKRISSLQADFADLILLRLRDFVEDEKEVLSLNHFDRKVYFRIFKHIMSCVDTAADPAEDKQLVTIGNEA